MSCVAPNSAPPLMAARRGVTAQEEKKSPAKTTARNPNVRRFTITISAVARGKQLKAARRESGRIVGHLGSGNQNSAAMVLARSDFVNGL